MVGNNTPVFFLRDPLKFPDLNHAVKRDPRTNMRSAQTNWDFWTLLPEALHQITVVMSDRGIPRSYRHMHGFGSHTFSFINADNQRFWVKFHFKSRQGIENLSNEEAAAIIAQDRESHQRDLYEAIEAWRLPALGPGTDHAGAGCRRLPLPPVRPVQSLAACRLPADRCRRTGTQPQPENYHAEVEQAAFKPGQHRPASASHRTRCCRVACSLYGDTNAIASA